MAVLGKRKAPEPTVSSEDAQEIFRRHFEAQFLPLEEQEKREAQKVRRNDDEDEEEDEDDSDGSGEDEWDGVSGDEVSDEDDDEVDSDEEEDDEEDGRSWNERIHLSYHANGSRYTDSDSQRRSHHRGGRPLRPAKLQSKHNVQTRTESLHGQSPIPTQHQNHHPPC